MASFHASSLTIRSVGHSRLSDDCVKRGHKRTIFVGYNLYNTAKELQQRPLFAMS